MGQMTTARAARTWLDVPFAQNDEAKAAGAAWHAPSRRWHAPHGMTPALRAWTARPDLPSTLPGEDREFGGRHLYVDMIPRSCWFTNVRSCVDAVDWDRIRRMVYTRAKNKCELCAHRPDRKAGEYLEAHERWDYLESTGTQVLRRLIALCSPCHTATHFGLAQKRGLEAQARFQLESVNGWSAQDVALHIEGTVEVWYARDQRAWHLDITMLTGAGVSVSRPPNREERARHHLSA